MPSSKQFSSSESDSDSILDIQELQPYDLQSKLHPVMCKLDDFRSASVQ